MLEELENIIAKINQFCGIKVDLEDFNQVSGVLTTFCSGWENLLKSIVVDDMQVPSLSEIKDKICSAPTELSMINKSVDDINKLKSASTPDLLVTCLLTYLLADESEKKKLGSGKRQAAEFIKMYLNDATDKIQVILKDPSVTKMAWIKWNALGELCRDLQYHEMFVNGLKMSEQSINSDLAIIKGLHGQMSLQSGGGRRKPTRRTGGIKKKGF
jgi:hypothetical protein